MTNKLTLEAARKAKDTCEAAVLAAAHAFEAETGLTLTDLGCHREHRVIGSPLAVSITAKDSDVVLGFGRDNFPF